MNDEKNNNNQNDHVNYSQEKNKDEEGVNNKENKEVDQRGQTQDEKAQKERIEFQSNTQNDSQTGQQKYGLENEKKVSFVGSQKSSQTGQQSLHHDKKKSKGMFAGFFKMLAAGVIGSVMTLGVVTQTDYLQPEENGQIPPQAAATETTAEPVSTDGSVADIAEQASEAIVGIVNMSEQPTNPFQQQTGEGQEVKKGVGSGVIYKVTDNAAYIVTNNHVIEGASSLQVALPDGDKVDGEIVGTDPLTDIAVVKIKGDYDMTPLKFGDSDALRSGDEVMAIGNPLGLEFSRTVTKGIVSAANRTIPVQTSAGKWDFDVIQTDAAISPGNSGGALINMQGELVGINSLKIANSQVEGLGFAIPSNKVQDLIEELAKNGKVERPYIGVGLRSVSDIPRYYLSELPKNVKDGIVVLSVDEDSAAAEAGIQVEDVIVSIDGENITNDNDLRGYLYKETEIGDTIKLELYRNGELKTVELTLTSNDNAE